MKNSLAIAYAMKRKRKKMAAGGDVAYDQDPSATQSFQEGFRKATHYADGGGVHESDTPNIKGRAGISSSGDALRIAQNKKNTLSESARRGLHKGVIQEHKEKLSELQSMPKPKIQGMAEGGFIEDNYQDPSWRTHQTKDGDVNHREMDSGYMSHEGNMQRPDEMAMMEDDKRLNQHPVDMHAETSMSEQDLVDRIMELRSKTFESEARNYSEGGRVANSDEIEAGFDPNEFDVLHLEDDLESTYGDDDNAGDELGNKGEDARRSDLVDRIMLKNFKQKYPRGYPGR